MFKLSDIKPNTKVTIKKFHELNSNITQLMELGFLINTQIFITNKLFKNIVFRMNGTYYSISYKLAKLIQVSI